MYTIGDFLIQVKNAYMIGKKQIDYPYSNAVLSIGKILEKEGFVKKISNKKEKSAKSPNAKEREMIVIELLYKNKMPAFSDVKLVSKPSVRRYMNKAKLAQASTKYGIAIVSTNRGMMTAKQAKKDGVGGELICQIY